jgi:calreticulin
MDGDWEAPSIANPEFQGKWTAKRIPNPAYNGPWVHPEIDNPEYKVDDEIYAYDFSRLGFDLWQVKSGTIFDDILITDDVEAAAKVRDEALELAKKEKEAKDAYDEVERKAAEEKAAAEAAAAKEAEGTTEADEQEIEEISLDIDEEEPATEEHVKDEL